MSRIKESASKMQNTKDKEIKKSAKKKKYQPLLVDLYN
jgi:hypothetical protein